MDTNINRFDGKGYGIKYLLDCLKIDDIEYYKSITEKDNIIDSAGDDEGAANIVIKYSKDRLLICEKTLYIYNNHYWNGDEKEVNKLLCNMITDLKIKFVGADNKRKYSYSSSVKHQRIVLLQLKIILISKSIIILLMTYHLIINTISHFSMVYILSKIKKYTNMKNCQISILLISLIETLCQKMMKHIMN